MVVKRNGTREPFHRGKIVAGLRSATKNLSVSAGQIESVASEVEETLRLDGQEVASAKIGLTVLERLRQVDGVAYVRFASVYKNFTDPADFAREVHLLTKSTEPKPPAEGA